MASKKFRLNSAASTNLTKIQDMGANMRGILAINTNAAARFLKFYDSVDPPTVGTTVPALTVQMPATAMTQLFPTDAVAWKNALWIATTVNAADSDATAVGAGDLLVSVFYE